MSEATFTLIAWLMMGQRFEEVRLPYLSQRQCGVYRDEMLRERSPLRAECMPGSPRAIMPRSEPPPRCAHHPCGSPVPILLQKSVALSCEA
jgi:hypothetical protein